MKDILEFVSQFADHFANQPDGQKVIENIGKIIFILYGTLVNSGVPPECAATMIAGFANRSGK